MKNISALYEETYKLLKKYQAEGHRADERNKKTAAGMQEKLKEIQRQKQIVNFYLSETSMVNFTGSSPVPNDPQMDKMERLYLSLDDHFFPDLQEDDIEIDDSDRLLELRKLALSAWGYWDSQESMMKRDYSEVPSKNTDWQTDFLASSQVLTLAKEIQSQTAAYYIDSKKTYEPEPPKENSDLLKIGVIQRPLPVPDPESAAKTFRGYYAKESGNLRLPFGFRLNNPIKLRLIHTVDMLDSVHRVMQGMMFNVIRHATPMSGRIFYLDALTYNPEVLGVLRPLAQDDGLIRFPGNQEDIVQTLRTLLADAQRQGENSSVKFLFIHGYPDSYDAKAKELIRTLAHNSKAYKIHMIVAGIDRENEEVSDRMAFAGALKIVRESTGYTIFTGKEHLPFNWFAAPGGIAPSTISKLQKMSRPSSLSKRMLDLYPLSGIPHYDRTRRVDSVELPFGYDVDTQKEHSLTLNRKNSFGFLMGSTGCGKSTLLHILITDVIRTYHPDDVELWLADFKKTEFGAYSRHCPPHIKYILCDDTNAFCCSFIERMTEEMDRRKKIFAANGWDTLSQVPENVHMPLILIIIDEFDILSQTIGDYVYERFQIQLQQLLSKGSAFGFRALFSTQSYTHGAAGLTNAARDNLAVRMAMNSPNSTEVLSTLDVTNAVLGESNKKRAENMPAYHLMIKNQEMRGAQVHFVANFFMSDEDLEQQQDWIDRLMEGLTADEQANSSNANSYTDKHPVIIDGIHAVEMEDRVEKMQECIVRERENGEAKETDLFLFPGNPCSMRSIQPVVLSCRRNNSIFLFGDYRRDRYGIASVAASSLASAEMSGYQTEIWSDPDDRCYSLNQSLWRKQDQFTDTEGIAERIYRLRASIEAGDRVNRLVIVFDAGELLQEVRMIYKRVASALSAEEDRKEEAKKEKEIPVWVYLEYSKQGLSIEKIEEMAANGEIIFDEPEYSDEDSSRVIGQEDYSGSMNLLEDIAYLMEWGPKNGCFILLVAESCASLKGLEFKNDLFVNLFAFRMKSGDAYQFEASRQLESTAEGVLLYSNKSELISFAPYEHGADY